MNKITILLLIALAGAGTWFARDLIGGEDATETPVATTTVPGELTLIEAVPFRLSTPMTHTWRAETPSFTEGILAVIEGDRELLAARQSITPLLMWGREIPQILNNGGQAGRVLVVLPLTNHQTRSQLDGAPLYFGPRALAESMTRDTTIAADTQARAEGATPVPSDLLPGPQAGETLADEIALYRRAADLLALHSPTETDCIKWLRGEAR